ncbi:MAG: hypothetical protein ACTSU5_14490 [Promethearchaeota archaeon]
MSYIPKYILKRIFPPDGLANLDTTGDGKVDSLRITYLNLISPIEIPDMDLEAEIKNSGVDLNDFSTIAKIKIDGKDIPIKAENISIWFEGEEYTLSNIQKAAGKTVPIGGKLTVVYKYGDIPVLEPGDHEFDVTTVTEGGMNFKIVRPIKPENHNIKFDPAST